MVTNHIAHHPDCCTFIFPAGLFGAYLKADVPVDRLSYMADLEHFLCVTDHKHFRVSIPLCLRIWLICLYCDFDMIELFQYGLRFHHIIPILHVLHDKIVNLLGSETLY